MKILCNSILTSFIIMLFACTSLKKVNTDSHTQPDTRLDEIIALIANQIEIECNCKAKVPDSTRIQYSPILSDTKTIENEIGEDKYLKLMKSYHNSNKWKVATHFQSSSESTNIAAVSFSNFGITPEKDMLMIYVGVVYGPLDGVGKIHIYEILFEDQNPKLKELYTIPIWVS